MNIIGIASNDYIPYLAAMLNSMKQNNSDFSLMAWLINPEEDFQKKLTEVSPFCRIESEKVMFENIEQQRCYCVNIRTEIFKKLRANGIGKMMYLDADTIVVGNCRYISELLDNNDVVLCMKSPNAVRRSGEVSYGRFCGGLVAVADSPNANIFIDEYSRKTDNQSWRTIQDTLEDEEKNWKIWMRSQDALDDVYEATKDNIKFAFVDRKYLCPHLNDDSFIWSAKSGMKRDSQKYKDAVIKFSGFKCL